MTASIGSARAVLVEDDVEWTDTELTILRAVPYIVQEYSDVLDELAAEWCRLVETLRAECADII